MSKYPNDIRIGIIGAGPSGLAAAEALKDKGYTNITVLEKKDRAGGMALSLTYQTSLNKNIIYEMGSIQPVSSPFLYHLIHKYDLHIGKEIAENNPRSCHLPLKIYSIQQEKPIIDYTKHFFGGPIKYAWPWLQDITKLTYYLLKYQKLSSPGFQLPLSAQQELSIPCDQWVRERKFKILEMPLRMLGVTMTMGDTEMKTEVSAIVLLKLFYQCLKWPPTRLRYLNGKHVLLKEGYQELWNRVAKNHNVKFNSHITRILREENEIFVQLDHSKYIFDKLIITASPKQIMNLLAITEEEKNVFSKVRYSPGWRIAFLGKGLPHDALYSFLEPYIDENYGPCLQGFYPEGKVTDDIWLYSAGISLPKNVAIEPFLKEAEKLLKDTFHGEVVEWLQAYYWPEYVPHFLPEDVAKGVYFELEKLQDNKNTYYSGGTFAGHSHATVAEYSLALVDKYF